MNTQTTTQLSLFDPPVSPEPAAKPLAAPPPMPPVLTTPPASIPAAAPPRPRGTPLALHVERQLRERNIPYVSVDEAKKALFASNRLKTFHFCVYAPEGSNWLLLCEEAGDANRADMQEWQNIFGDGFKAVFAVERKAGVVFRTLAGERVSLDEIAP